MSLHVSLCVNRLTVGLGNTLDLVLLLNSIGVGGTLCGVHEFISEALGNGLDVAEAGFAGTLANQVDGLVDAAEGGDVDCLAAHDTGCSDTCAILTGSCKGNSVDNNLDWVFVGEEVDDVQGIANDVDCAHLITTVVVCEHE